MAQKIASGLWPSRKRLEQRYTVVDATKTTQAQSPDSLVAEIGSPVPMSTLGVGTAAATSSVIEDDTDDCIADGDDADDEADGYFKSRHINPAGVLDQTPIRSRKESKNKEDLPLAHIRQQDHGRKKDSGQDSCQDSDEEEEEEEEEEGLKERATADDVIRELNLGDRGWRAIDQLEEQLEETLVNPLDEVPDATPSVKVGGIVIPDYDSYVRNSVTIFCRQQLKLEGDEVLQCHEYLFGM